MVDFSFSKEFVRLAESGQLNWTTEAHRDGYTIWHPASLTYLIEKHGEEYQLARFERTNPPTFNFFATDLKLIERRIIAAMCADYRQIAHLPRFDVYRMARSIKKGFVPHKLDEYYYTLRDTKSGQLYPMRVFEGSNMPLEPTYLSHIVTVPIEDLFEAYMAPDGAPLFSDFIYKRPRE